MSAQDLASSEPAKGQGASPQGGSTSASTALRPRLAAAVEWLLIGVTYFMLYFEPHWIGADGGERFDALVELLTKHTLPGTRYSMVGPVFSAPLFYLGKALGQDPRKTVAYYNWVLLGVFVVLVARLLRGVLEPTASRRFLLLLLAGSMFGFHVQPYYAEVFTSSCVATGVLAVCLRRCSWLGWIAIVLGAANTPGAALGAGLVCLFFAVDGRRLRFVLPVLAIGAILAFETFVRRKGKTGYEDVHQNETFMPYSGRPGFSYPMFLGLLSLTASFGKGILFYAPGVFAPVKDLLRGKAELLKAHRVWLVFLAGLMLLYSKFCGWYGGQFWGPRYVMFASVPASFALALNLGSRSSPGRAMVTLVMLTLSVWVCADGVVFDQKDLDKCWENNYGLEHLCWYVPEFSAWIRPFIKHKPIDTLNEIVLGVYGLVYLYLALPVAAYLVRATFPWIKPRVQRLLEWRAWGV